MYINPRLKHVKNMMKILNANESLKYSAVGDQIINQCSLLLETKKAKKRKKAGKDINVPTKLDYEKMDKEQAVLETLEDLAFRVKRYADHGKKTKFIKIKREDIEGNYDFVDPKEESKKCSCNPYYGQYCEMCRPTPTPNRSEESRQEIIQFVKGEVYDLNDICYSKIPEFVDHLLAKYKLTPKAL